MLSNYKHFLVFVFSFFSIGALFNTLFAPWKRLGETYSGGFDLENLLGSFIVNTLMRILGFCIRFLVIILGFIVMLIVAILGVCVLCIWVLLPALLPFVFVLSITKLLAL